MKNQNSCSGCNLKLSLKSSFSLEKVIFFVKYSLSKNLEIQDVNFETYYIVEEVFLMTKPQILQYFKMDLRLLKLEEFNKIFHNKIMQIKDKIGTLDIVSSLLKLLIKELNLTVKKRLDNIPLDYIFGRKNFYGNNFFVSKYVLIPRYDSEILIEKSVKSFLNFLTNSKIEEKIREINILDICCGSGCLGISLAIEIIKRLEIEKVKLTKKVKLKLVFVDISIQALGVTRKNVDNLLKKGLINNSWIEFSVNYKNLDILTYFHADFTIKKSLLKKNHFDYILYNPPYIERDEIKKLSKEVQNEPILALDGGFDGLDFYRILKNILELKKHDRYVRFFAEIGYNQKESIENILKQNQIKDFYFNKDFGGNFRLLSV